jgi:hypothetical protein
MKKLGLIIFAAAVLVFPGRAQVAGFRADIPFEFVVGNATVPAGQYVISFLPGPAVKVEGSGFESGYVHVFHTVPGDLVTKPQEPRLVFHRYGNRYFLSKLSTTSEGRALPLSHAERELKKTATAAGNVQTDIVATTGLSSTKPTT